MKLHIRKPKKGAKLKIASNNPRSGSGGSGFLFPLIINGIILYYLIGLEKDHCKCYRDKYHNELKYLTIFNLGWPLFALILFGLIFAFGDSNMLPKAAFAIISVYASALLLGAIVLWRYVGKLNKEQCVCAVKDMKQVNSFLMVWRWIQLILACLTMLFLVIAIYFFFTYG